MAWCCVVLWLICAYNVIFYRSHKCANPRATAQHLAPKKGTEDVPAMKLSSGFHTSNSTAGSLTTLARRRGWCAQSLKISLAITAVFESSMRTVSGITDFIIFSSLRIFLLILTSLENQTQKNIKFLKSMKAATSIAG